MTHLTPRAWVALLYRGVNPHPGFVEFRFLKSGARQFMPWPAFEGHPDEFHLSNAPAGQEIYWGVSLRRENTDGKASNCQPTHLNWTDIDLVDHPEVTGGLTKDTLLQTSPAELTEYKTALLAQVLEHAAALNLPPRAVVDSGHGLQVYWARRTTPSSTTDTEPVNRALATAFGGDSKSVDIARILRVPGSQNLKNRERPLDVQVMYSDADAWVEHAALDAIKPAPAPKPTPAPAPSIGPVSGATVHERYAQTALAREIAAMSSTGEGGRNEQLNRSAFSLGTLIGAGILDEGEAAQELTQAARAAGLDDDEIRDTLRSGLAGGKAKPRDLSGIGTRHWENRPAAFGTIGKGGAAATATRELPDKPTLTDYRDLVLDWCAEQGHIYRYHQTRRSWWQYSAGVYTEVIDEIMYQRIDKILQAYGYTNLKTANIREVLDKISREEHIGSLDVDQRPWELNTLNGILNLETGELADHSHEYFSIIQSAAAYHPRAVAHDWLAFLRQAVPSETDRLTLQMFAGLCLTGDTSPQRALTLIGDGGTGKSTFTKVLAAVLGKLATSSALENIKDGSFLVGNLVGKRMCVVSELQQGQGMDWLPFKRITGEDTISIDVKNKTPFTAKLDIKLIILSNVMPRLGEDTSNTSLMRRFLPVAFNVKPAKPDPHLEARLTDPTELPGVLNWMIQGLELLRANNMRFPDSDSGNLAREIQEDSNKVISFLRDECRYTPDVQTSGSELYAEYRRWCGQNGFSPLHINNFGKHLLAAGQYFGRTLERDRTYRGTEYKHVQLSTTPGGWEGL